MNILSGRLTCYQCHQDFSDGKLYCPNCGAARRETTGQSSLRRLRRAGINLAFGAVVGVVGALILGILFPDFSATTLNRFPLLQSRFGLEVIGLILGGIVGAIVYTMRELAHERE